MGTNPDRTRIPSYKFPGNLMKGLVSEQVSVNDTESQIVELDIRNLNGFTSNRPTDKQQSLLNMMTQSESVLHTKNESTSNFSHFVKVVESHLPSQGVDNAEVTADIIENEG